MGKNAVTLTNTKYETKRYDICKMPQQICTTVPLECTNKDRKLQNCELKMNPNDEKYPSDALHVYT